MRLSQFIARRYLFSKNNPNAINIISGISVVGFAVGAMALVSVLSVFNGFESLVQSLYNSFDPDIKITVVEGKVFSIDSLPLEQISRTEGVKAVAYTLEENVALRYDERQTIATLKGVSDDFIRVSRIDSMIFEGEFLLKRGENRYALAGLGVAARLGLSPYNDFTRLGIYVPRRGAEISYNPERALNQVFVYPTGVFSIDDEINNRYVLVPLELAYELLDRNREVTALEIGVTAPGKVEQVQRKLQEMLGPGFEVKNREQQQEALYRVFKYEKWATSVILVFIMLLLTFTVISALSMLVIEKRRDISILRSMGAGDALLRWVFIREGLLIAVLGGSIGLLVGFLLCWIQQTYGFITFGSLETFIVTIYPVKIVWTDFLYTFLFILLLGFLVSWYPSSKAASMPMSFHK